MHTFVYVFGMLINVKQKEKKIRKNLNIKQNVNANGVRHPPSAVRCSRPRPWPILK